MTGAAFLQGPYLGFAAQLTLEPGMFLFDGSSRFCLKHLVVGSGAPDGVLRVVFCCCMLGFFLKGRAGVFERSGVLFAERSCFFVLKGRFFR